MASNLPHHRPFTRLLLLIIGILFSLVIIGSYGFHAIQRDLLANSGKSLALAATDIADKIDRWILERVEDIDFIAQSLAPESQDPETMTSILKNLQNSYPAVRSLSIVDPSGRRDSSLQDPQNNPQWEKLQGLTAIQSGRTYYIEVAPPL
ncbi:MAG: PDC sensor domain-containing protein [Nitrospirae bacterium]|nr:PDC sensor domain-containing protein [Nitrospirota bacterium]MDA1303228.1 PDC sensor domain-containing protein [Nitrospirota bacterium]